MSVFRRLYDAMIRASRHPHADWYLGAVSFSESSFFPIPPDVMLAPMTLAMPRRWWWLAGLTTLASVLGGAAGWLIGAYGLEVAWSAIERLGYAAAYGRVTDWFAAYGFWAVLAAGFTPVPYKLFTIAAGAAAMPILPFLAASTVGRGARFFLVAGLVRWVGPRIEPVVLRHINVLGWLFLVLLVGGLAWVAR